MGPARQEPKRRGATTRALAQVNSTSITELLRRSGALSRREIQLRTGLSPATINRLTAALIASGVLVVAGHEPSSGGRPSILLRYAGDARLVAAIQLHAERAAGVLVDLDGQIVLRRDVALPGALTPGASDEVIAKEQAVQLKLVMQLLDLLIAAADGLGAPCVSVGVAVPGTVAPPDDSVARMPEIGWDEVPLGRILRERFDLPIIVENDANALAFGELNRGAGRGTSSLVSLLLARGLGAGIISNGELHRGASAKAGEVGYLLMDRTAFARSYDEHGDLEDRIGSHALTRQARERGIAVPAGELITAEDVFQLAVEGNSAAGEIAAEILDLLSLTIAALVTVLDPELVVVASNFGNAERLVPEIQKRLTGRIIEVPRLVPATFREDAVLIGVAELAAAAVNQFTYLS
ncbi:MAG: ROK family protein [Microbacteriaceae bacterium]|nr:MAG: ROK family protein [Microbacteriaceae bacterium]